ncbi:MAG: ATP-NAD kinase family protein [Candidatus Altiarchaeota archaeon]
MKTVGFCINPIAGLGGSVGLKGTDGLAEKALKLGACPLAGARARQALESVLTHDALFLTCTENMGENELKDSGLAYKVVYSCRNPTTSDDTRRACKAFLEHGAELIVFSGGDGTARDVYSVVGDSTPILGIPAGVKMHSSVFALNPRAAGELLSSSIKGDAVYSDAEVVDVDEKAYRENRLETKLYGIAKTPYKKNMTQAGKTVLHAPSEDKAREDLAKFSVEFMEKGTLYLLGAGSTTKAIAEELGVDYTLLGVDALKDGKIIGKDLSESDIMSLIEKEKKVKIIVSPTGRQGFLFGRGNQQFSPRVLIKAGIKNIIPVATPQKLIETPVLHVDTGDPKTDKAFGEYTRVVCGWKLAAKMPIR